MKIRSLTNPRIKQIVRLKNSKDRKASQLTVVNGIREIKQAGKAGVEIKEVYICPEFCKDKGLDGFIEEISRQKVSIYEVTPGIFQKIAFGDRKEGILGVCRTTVPELSDLKGRGGSRTAPAFFVIVEQVEKPGNLGAILRTCDAAGVDALIVSDRATDVYNPNVIRASLGTVFSVPFAMAANEEILRFLRERNIKIIATSPAAQEIYTATNMKGPLAVVAGSEQEGLSDFWIRHSDISVRIPMKGQADSLNVSASTAILLYEVIRQRSTGE